MRLYRQLYRARLNKKTHGVNYLTLNRIGLILNYTVKCVNKH